MIRTLSLQLRSSAQRCSSAQQAYSFGPDISPQQFRQCIGLSSSKDIIQLEERLTQHLLAQLQPLPVSELMSQKGSGHENVTMRWA